jgi:hypothetical protein
MAAKVFFSVSMSLDGFIAPQERANDPDVERWTSQWMELQQWIFPLRFFRENLKLGMGGEEGRDNDIARESFERTSVDASRGALEPVRAEPTQRVTHLTYAVRER